MTHKAKNFEKTYIRLQIFTKNLWQLMRRITLICDNVLIALEPAKTDFRRRLASFCGCPEQIWAWTND